VFFYLRYSVSYRDFEETLAERGVTVDHATLNRWVVKIATEPRDVGVLAVTSADRLNAGWTAAQRARAHGATHAKSHIETLLHSLPRYCKTITAIEGHPATLAWLGGVGCHQTISRVGGAFWANRNHW